MSENTQRNIIGWTLALVLMLGAIEIRLFLRPPSTVLKAMSMAQKSRLPAGASKVNTSSNIVLDVADEILNYNLGCKPKLFKIEAGEARQVRIRYETCPKEDYKISSIVNSTNAYQATIFNLDHDKQTSDFIPLKEGQNRVKIVLVNSAKQQSEQEFVFTRNALDHAQK